MAINNETFLQNIEKNIEYDNIYTIKPIHDEFWETHCSVITPEESRFIMVGIVGSLVAIISVIFNTFLFSILISSRNNRYSQLLYLIFLAFSDIFLSASYILMFPVNIFMDYFENEFMSTAWFSYVKYVFSTCHITMTGSALLITLATFERFLTVKKIKNNFTMAHRIILTVIVFIFALLAKGPLFWELMVENNYNCTGVTAYIVGFNDFAREEPYKTFYTFWFRCLISTFLPFFLSFYFNIQIVLQLRKQQVGARLFRFGISEHRHNIRSATRMLVLVTCTYLASNLLNVIVATWEAFDSEFLTSEEIRPYYTISSDLISLLTVLACALRLPIYYACNQRIRQEVNLKLSKMCFCKSYFDRFQFEYAPTIRYLNSGNGYVIRRSKSKLRSQNQDNQNLNIQQCDEKCIGTGLDKIVLSVAMTHTIPSNSLDK
ncbi:GPCR, rhodopsin-like, 7TM domain-containing protein [Strongyloides ratti]|uniref:GPCR, rhodopsin-like, 7TM domain-containing protein n=1 Tax=Strongyloides ratti TaxID=34506 RepID=A0A090KPT4_STRRB|nr:GPCR, rhodopsin-like, 7TM domain-containing protein [Strongyloides ratti]CEF59394.1 GPCR, rhodopsin-like, 7TM domain-containing protein [Strongyloides ratti]